MPSRGICVPFIFTLICAISLIPAGTLCSAETGKDVAWNLIVSGLHSNSSEERVSAVRVLGWPP